MDNRIVLCFDFTQWERVAAFLTSAGIKFNPLVYSERIDGIVIQSIDKVYIKKSDLNLLKIIIPPDKIRQFTPTIYGLGFDAL